MSLLEQLTAEMKKCLKAGDARRLSTIRLLISAIKYALVDNPSLDEEGMVAVLQREAKKRRESIAAYTEAGRAERASEEQVELEIIQEYLPVMMSTKEVQEKAKEILGGEKFANPGLAVGRVMGQLKGRADGATVAQVVKQLLLEQ